jgi:hypothetical protein
MRDLNIALESPDDDIIELEDIIEMPAGFIDEDEDLDVNVFDLDPDLAPEEENQAQNAARPFVKEKAKRQSSEGQDLLKSFGDEEDEKLFEPAVSRLPGKKSKGKAEPPVSKDQESFLDEFMDKAAIAEESVEPAAPKEAPPVSAPIPPAVDLSKVAEELIAQMESRLQQHIQAMVESRLPELVRSIINEEVEKLKKEL